MNQICKFNSFLKPRLVTGKVRWLFIEVLLFKIIFPRTGFESRQPPLNTRFQFYKKFHGSNLQMFLKSLFVPGRLVQPSLMLMGKTRSLPRGGTSECVTLGQCWFYPQTSGYAGNSSHEQTLYLIRNIHKLWP